MSECPRKAVFPLQYSSFYFYHDFEHIEVCFLLGVNVVFPDLQLLLPILTLFLVITKTTTKKPQPAVDDEKMSWFLQTQ